MVYSAPNIIQKSHINNRYLKNKKRCTTLNLIFIFFSHFVLHFSSFEHFLMAEWKELSNCNSQCVQPEISINKRKKNNDISQNVRD